MVAHCNRHGLLASEINCTRLNGLTRGKSRLCQRSGSAGLAQQMSRAGVALSMERVEILLQPLFARRAGIDRAARPVRVACGRWFSSASTRSTNALVAGQVGWNVRDDASGAAGVTEPHPIDAATTAAVHSSPRSVRLFAFPVRSSAALHMLTLGCDSLPCDLLGNYRPAHR